MRGVSSACRGTSFHVRWCGADVSVCLVESRGQKAKKMGTYLSVTRDFMVSLHMERKMRNASLRKSSEVVSGR